jgi:anionic cell wall polymer biosynthesis LytR-Cps2A-Psr (LCP) family protein
VWAFGGVELTVSAVEHLLDVNVNHLVDVLLTGLHMLTNATTRAVFPNGTIDFSAGT